MGAFLRGRQLSKRYGPIHALRGVDLSVARGGSLVLLGPNGAGKSTLLGILAGRIRPTEGSVVLEGGEIRSGTAARTRTGYLAHASLLYPGLTALENLRFTGQLYGVKTPLARAEELLDFVGLTRRGDDRVGGFSRGMQQRLSIARALVHDPELILLDEPFSGLDYHSSRSFADDLAHLRDGRRTIVVATHDMDAVSIMGEDVAVMDRGRIVHLGAAPEDVRGLYTGLLGQEGS
ncbi:MAG: ABC transporter ATP-binding protein [bacterium]|nr:ABC transporter ATP-binding protein [bacterium]